MTSQEFAESPGDGEEERLLSVEAEAAVREVSFAVDHVSISGTLPCNSDIVYLNMRTKEQKIFCVQLTIEGFAIVGEQFDSPSVNEKKDLVFYETIYQLLDSNSEQYRHSFGMALSEKLEKIAKCS
ncbi:GSK3B-interacting protein-like [Symsagittifera roscoffensis]|uniref:GSK3B-interacting protein-like n=1 Tax=Symsagittifera roscoffensis TaxID=84072 RepID=UPI00307BAD4A